MPTRKQQLQTLIDTNLESGTSITAAEHRSVETSIINAAIPANRGWFSGIDVLGSGPGYLTCSGDITSAYVTSIGGLTSIDVYIQTSMENTNYMVKIYPESQATDYFYDASVLTPIFKITTQQRFLILIREADGGIQNIKFHLEVVSLDY